MGAVFQQLVQGSWAPLAFYILQEALFCQDRLLSFDHELLAAYSTVKHFCFLLGGRSFTLFTDHKPLTFAMFKVSPPWSARQQGHLSYLSEFTSDLVHLPSLQNVVADALSRPSSVLSPTASTSRVDMVQDPGLAPFGEFLPRFAPSFVVLPSPLFPVYTLQSLSFAWPVDFSLLSF